MAIYFVLNLPFPVCFGVSAVWESFQLTLCSENVKVGTIDQHPGKGCGCAWAGSKWSGLIFSWSEAGFGSTTTFQCRVNSPGKGCTAALSPGLCQQHWAGGIHLFPDSNPFVCHSCSFLSTESSFQLRDSTNWSMDLWKKPDFGNVCCHSSLVQ